MTKKRDEEKEPKAETLNENAEAVNIETIVDPLEAANREAQDMKELAQRVQAEFDNYRKRNAEAVKNAKADGENAVIFQLCAVSDNFERALSLLDDASKEGVSLIFKQFSAVFERFGVEEIKAEGAPFDPNEHNAVMTVEDAEHADTVTEVLQKGYKRNNRVLRAAMVKVAK